MTRAVTALMAAVFCFASTPAIAEPADWPEGNPDADDGATRDYYNRGGLLPWAAPRRVHRERCGSPWSWCLWPF